MFSNLNHKLSICVMIVFALTFGACHRERCEPLCLVCVIDLTRRIEAESQREAFDAIQAALKKLRRGDTVAIIPITGDALTDAQGRVIRLQLNDRREAYDEDLRRFAEEVADRLQHLRDEVANNPYNRSDVLGAVRLAGEEMANTKPAACRALVLLSDFLQDDAQYNFRRDARLANDETAAKFADSVARNQPQVWQQSTVFLGFLRSVDLKGLPQTRRAALQVFWREFFTRQGAVAVRSATDGAGQVAAFVQQQREQSEPAKAGEQTKR
ncbi:MAG TPA: hypothetical protein VJ464_23865 [Blastocatellia bacterium]|nr:hypothetical protein [Blastocatellia bacterium]